IYACLGTVGYAATESQQGSDSFLVCLELPSQGDGQFHLRWHHEASHAEGNEKESVAYWEGAPVVRDDQVFIARTEITNNSGMTSIDCYDAETGGFRWRRESCVPVPCEP